MIKQLILLLLIVCICGVARGQVTQGKLLGTWSDTTLVGSDLYNNAYNEVWGYAAENREYAIIGSSYGTHFIDVTNPSDPIHLHVIEGGTTGREIVHRDYHDNNGFLYAVSDEGRNSTLQIIDLSYLPDSVPVVYDSKEYIRRSHNIFIDTSSSILYCCFTQGDSLDLIPLRLFDISDPLAPQFLSEFDKLGDFQIGDVHDAYVRNDTAYLNCGNYGFVVADFSDPQEPETLATLTTADYPQAGYNHSGWLSPDGKTYAMADETWNKDIKLMDVSNLPEIRFITTVDAANSNIYSIPHNQIIHGDYLYAGYYYDGLQVYDISDPINPERIIHYPTSKLEPKRTYEGAWGIYPFLPSGIIIVSDMQEGLFIIDSVENTITSSNEEQAQPIEVTVSPNPNNGHFRILPSTLLTNAVINLYSVDGAHIMKLNNSGNYNLSLESGSYILTIRHDQWRSIKKFVVGK